MGPGSWRAAVSPHRKWKSVQAAMEVIGVVARAPMPAGRWASGRRVLVCALPVLFLVLPLTPVALAGTSISIVTSSRALAPAQGDYATGYVESLAPTGGIRVRVTTTAPAGLILYVSCSAGSPPIDMSHLLIRCPTVGSLIATYETSLYDEWGDARADYALGDLFGVKGGKPRRAAAGKGRCSATSRRSTRTR